MDLQRARVDVEFRRQLRRCSSRDAEIAAKVPTSSATDTTGKWNSDSQVSQTMAIVDVDRQCAHVWC